MDNNKKNHGPLPVRRFQYLLEIGDRRCRSEPFYPNYKTYVHSTLERAIEDFLEHTKNWKPLMELPYLYAAHDGNGKYAMVYSERSSDFYKDDTEGE